jgi:hypothetical protein
LPGCFRSRCPKSVAGWCVVVIVSNISDPQNYPSS